jgi:hypothetical protein
VKEKNAGMQAANAAWFAPLLTILCNVVGTMLKVEPIVSTAIAFFGFALILFGFGAAIFALASMRKYGIRGILIPALIGLVINSFIIYLLVDLVLKGGRRA